MCSDGVSVEEYEIKLPQGMQVLSVPDGVAFSSPVLSYESSYHLEGHTLGAKRRLEDKTKGNVCSAQSQRQYKAELDPVWKNLRQQVLYK